MAVIGVIATAFLALGPKLKEIGGRVSTFFTDLWKDVSKNAKEAWDKIVEKLGEVWGNLTKPLTEGWDKTWKSLGETVSNAWTNLTTGVQDIADELHKIFKTLKTNILNVWQGMWDGIKGFVNSIIDAINYMVTQLNKISFSIPSWVPGGLGGKSWGFNLPKLRRLEKGGLVDQEQLVLMGEKNHKEAAVPLENPTYMRPFSQAVANDLADMLGGSTRVGGNNTERQILYVGTLIADDRSLKELQRKMDILKVKENTRVGGARA
jgi:hypothetical protein